MSQDTTTALKPIFVDVSGNEVGPLSPWPAMVVPRAVIEAEIDRLAAMPPPDNGIRAVAVVHPYYTGPGNGIAQGFDAVINVLKPGEATAAIRRNCNSVYFGIRGHGSVVVNGDLIPLGKWDTCNVPSMQRYEVRNDGDDLFVWLSCSNAPLLDALQCHFEEKNPPVQRLAEPRPRRLNPGAFDVEIDGGARLQSGEYLSDIDVVQSRALLWPWEKVKERIAFSSSDGGRDVVLLYNEATERRAGTSASFFVTMIGGTTTDGLQHPSRWGHRHTPATIIYHMMGKCVGEVDGERISYEQGDLVMLAPAWARHVVNCGVDDPEGGDWASFALQDHPPHIAQESLIWQDDAADAIGALGLDSEADYLAYSAEVRKASDLAARLASNSNDPQPA